MLDHEGPKIHVIEEGCCVASCSCGWETEVCDNNLDAIREFNHIHFFGNPRDEELAISEQFYNYGGCDFCGHEDHAQSTCPRKPIYKVA